MFLILAMVLPGVVLLTVSAWAQKSDSNLPKLSSGQRSPELVESRLRSLDNFALIERTRFSQLQKASVDLSNLLSGEAAPRSQEVGESFYQFIFPFGLRDKVGANGYGYFSAKALKFGLIRNQREFLAEFSEETQQTLAEPQFLKALAAMAADGKLPEGRQFSQYDDSQLAAMGNYLFSRRRYSSAAEVWSTLAKLDPSSSLFAQAAGQSLFAAKQFEAAAALLRKSLVLSKGWGTADFRLVGGNLQDIYADVADLAAARDALEEAIKGNPKNEDLKFLMAYIDVFHGLRNRAQERLEKLAAAGDLVAAKLLEILKSGRVAGLISRPLPARMKPEEQARLAPPAELTPQERQALVSAVLEPTTFDDYMHRGDYMFFVGNYSRASDAYGEAALMKPDSAVALFSQVHASFANGEYGLAAKMLKEALKLEPNWGLFNFRLVEFFGERRDFDKRVRDLEHLNEINRDDKDKELLLGYIYYFDGRYAEAARVLSKVVTPEDPDFQVANQLLKLARLQG
jgi:tetratricopeptide (TPR) repeat protein